VLAGKGYREKESASAFYGREKKLNESIVEKSV